MFSFFFLLTLFLQSETNRILLRGAAGGGSDDSGKTEAKPLCLCFSGIGWFVPVCTYIFWRFGVGSPCHFHMRKIMHIHTNMFVVVRQSNHSLNMLSNHQGAIYSRIYTTHGLLVVFLWKIDRNGTGFRQWLVQFAGFQLCGWNASRDWWRCFCLLCE